LERYHRESNIRIKPELKGGGKILDERLFAGCYPSEEVTYRIEGPDRICQEYHPVFLYDAILEDYQEDERDHYIDTVIRRLTYVMHGDYVIMVTDENGIDYKWNFRRVTPTIVGKKWPLKI
jgi:hypothetical protein